MIRGELKPGLEAIEKILATFPLVNANWLVKGEGVMLLDPPRRVRPANRPAGILIDLPITLPELGSDYRESTIPEMQGNARFDARNHARKPLFSQTKSIDFAQEERSPYLPSQPAQSLPAKAPNGGKNVLKHPQPHPLEVAGNLVQVFNQPHVITEDSSGRPNIAFVRSEAMAGYPKRYMDPEYFADLPKGSLPFNALRQGAYRAFTVRGRSMMDTLFDGDVVICEFVENWPSSIRNGQIHVLVTSDNIVVKRLHNRIQEAGYLVCQSDNIEEERTFTMPATEIIEVWRVVFNITANLPNRNLDVRTRIADVEARIHQLESAIKPL